MRDKFEWRIKRNQFNHSHDVDQGKLPNPGFFGFNFNGQSRIQAWFVNMKSNAKSNMKSIRSTQAFTMVEVLVVLGLIMLLAALLFPALSRAREGGRRTACLSNLSQVARGLQMYVQDNNRRYPPIPPAPADGSEGWALAIANTLKNDAIFQCPSQGEPINKGFTDYWLNGDLQGISEVRLRTPTSVILAGDGEPKYVDYAVGLAVGPNVTDPWAATDTFTTRHLDGANYAFADGHVKWLLPDKISLIEEPTGANYTFVIG